MISLLAGEKPGESLLNWVVWILPKISTGVPVQRCNVKKKLSDFEHNICSTLVISTLRRLGFKQALTVLLSLVYLMTSCSSAAACFSSFNEIWIPIWTLREQIPEKFFWLTCECCVAYWRLITTFGEEIHVIYFVTNSYILVKINNENVFDRRLRTSAPGIMCANL